MSKPIFIHIVTLTYWARTWKFEVAFSWKGQCFVCWILEGDDLHTRFSFFCNDHISLAHRVEKLNSNNFQEYNWVKAMQSKGGENN